jgi:hypothetical protein
MTVVTPPSRNVLDSPHVHRAARGVDDALRGWIFVVKEMDQVWGKIVRGSPQTHVRSNGQTYGVQVELEMRQLQHPPPLSGSLN